MVTQLEILISEYLFAKKENVYMYACVVGRGSLQQNLHLATSFIFKLFFFFLKSHTLKFSRAKLLHICFLFWPGVTFGKQDISIIF